MVVKKHYAVGFRLSKEDMKKFKFIQQAIRNVKIKRGELPSYGIISKSEALRECLKLVYNYFASQEYKKIEMIRELKRDVLRDKIKLWELRNEKE